MADNRRYGLTPQLDIGQILLEAKNRWLRPTEVCEILRNYRKFNLAPDPPHKPTDGSLFLFDRKALRYFRKDGLNWRKKKDGKTVREAHERLKAGSVDVLHCYYAHGEDNENFQRRSYWMLEEEYEHIVFVHYREVKEGNKAGIARSTNTDRLLPIGNSGGQIASSAYSTQAHASSLLAQTTYASSPSTAEWNGPTHSSEFEEPESGDDVGASSLAEAECSSEDQGSILRQPNINEELVVDSGGQLPRSYLKAFTGLSAENKGSYSSFNVNEVVPGQYSFLELQLPVQGNFLNQDDVSQLDIPLQNTCLSGYSSGETSNLGHRQGLEQGNYSGRETPLSAMTLDLSGCKYLLGQGKDASTAENQVSNGHDINSSTWTEVLEQSTAELLSVAQPKVPCMQTMTSEDITRRQTHVMIDAFVRELSERQQTFPDAHLHDPSSALVQTSAEQMGSQRLTSNSPLLNVDQRETGESGFESLNAFQQKKYPCSDSQQFQLPAYQYNNEQRKPQLQVNDNSELWQNEYLLSSKLEASNDLDLEKNMVYSEIPKQCLQECSLQAEGQEGLKKLDSFGRWMSREIGRDGEDSLVASDSGMYWNTLESQNGVEEVSSLSRQIHLDVDLMGPSLSQDQLFSISDFSPDWAYPEQDTKVLIIGTFLGRLKTTHEHKLGCMFGEIEVSAEILAPGVLRCQAPPHVPGRVPFYVTCSNRLACSEVREFEYRAGPFQDMNAGSNMDAEAVDETLLQIRFVKSLSLNFDKGQSFLCINNEVESSSLSRKIHSLIKDSDEEWSHLEIATKHSGPSPEKIRGNLMEKLLKEKLYAWLLWKTDEGKTPNALDDHGQGVIHMAAALGYSWAIGPIVAAGVNINFRDVHGWTALHWAAFCGREQTVVALIALGAAPGALTDPTQKFAAGRTPADLASSRGHKGIAGYLAESSLTSHLSSLTIKENIMGSMSATLAGEKAVETVAERTVVQCDKAGRDDQLSLKDSLAAVRNAAQAAARIQSAFRARSFRVRQLIEYGDDKCGMSDEEALSFVSVQKAHKLGSNDEPLHTAAIRIQRKFRGWKGRKEFLIIRQRIVKIQAHVRGHQVRKHYRKIIWSVGIVEKAILRWRRKGAGLRGFRAEGVIEDSNIQNGGQNESDDYDFLRAGRKQTEAGLEKALARVQSMVQYPEARDQYRRLLTTFQETKVDFEGTADGESPKLCECKTNEEDALMSITD